MIAHFDCVAGASGDMLLAALLDAGASVDAVMKHLETLPVAPITITVDEVHRRGIRATHIDIAGTAEAETYRQARQILESSALSDEVRAMSLAILSRLGEAEARVHGVDLDDVHFHEISATDTIADIVGVAAAISELGIDGCTCSPVPTGWGVVATQHGQLPIPAPAVLELLKGAVLRQVDIPAELVTPTGAAILSELSTRFGAMPSMIVRSTGYGAGTADLEIPNVLRVVIGDPAAKIEGQIEEVLIEANIDDMNPELYEFISHKLFEADAHDVWLVPIIGKRGRPANIISVLAPPSAVSAIRQVLVQQASTIGVRTTSVSRWMLDRTWEEVEVQGQPIRIKIAKDSGTIVNVAPEYADCVRVANETGLPLKEVYRIATAQAHRLHGEDVPQGPPSA